MFCALKADWHTSYVSTCRVHSTQQLQLTADPLRVARIFPTSCALCKAGLNCMCIYMHHYTRGAQFRYTLHSNGNAQTRTKWNLLCARSVAETPSEKASDRHKSKLLMHLRWVYLYISMMHRSIYGALFELFCLRGFVLKRAFAYTNSLVYTLFLNCSLREFCIQIDCVLLKTTLEITTQYEL